MTCRSRVGSRQEQLWIVVQGIMQPVKHRPRAKSDVTLSRCSVACRNVLRGASIETLGVRRLEFVEGPMDTAGSTQVAYNVRAGHGFDLSIGVMIAGNSGRPGGAIYKPWFASPEQRLQGVHPGHRTQEESIPGSLARRFGTHSAAAA